MLASLILVLKLSKTIDVDTLLTQYGDGHLILAIPYYLIAYLLWNLQEIYQANSRGGSGYSLLLADQTGLCGATEGPHVHRPGSRQQLQNQQIEITNQI